jgi:hypothetical protein
MVEPAADRHSGRRDGGGRGEGMSVENDQNFVTLSNGLAASIEYLDNQWHRAYSIWLRRNTADEWVSE